MKIHATKVSFSNIPFRQSKRKKKSIKTKHKKYREYLVCAVARVDK